MQGYNWTSNQRPPPKYQEKERPPPKYQERPLPKYQERLLPMYQPTRNYQPPNTNQTQFNPQLYTSPQQRYSSGQQQYVNHWNSSQGVRSNSGDSFALVFQPKANQTHPHPFRGSQTQQHCTQGMVSQTKVPSENPNTHRYYAQFSTPHVYSRQNYGNIGPVQNNGGPNQAPLSLRSDRGGSRTGCNDNTRSWNFHISDNGSSCHMNNQQQPCSSRTAPLHHQQWFSGQQSDQQQTMQNTKPGCSQQSTSWAQNNGTMQRMYISQAQNTETIHYTSNNSVRLPHSGAQKSISPPSINFQKSPVMQSQLGMMMNTGPNVSATQFQNSQSNNEQQSIDNRTCSINQTAQNQTQQKTLTNEAQPNPQSKPDLNLISYVNPLLYRLLCSDDNEEGFANSSAVNKQPSDGRTRHQSAQFTDEPPSKRMYYGVFQKDYWNQVPSKKISISKDASGFASQSVLPDINQTGRTEQSSSEKRHGTRQHGVQYTADPADCLEAVFSLQKAAQQVHKAIAIVPPISQQTSNTELMDDTSPKTVDSPPLKIDTVWSIAEEPDALSFVTKVNDKLSELPAPVTQQDDRRFSIQTETTNNITVTSIPQSPDICLQKNYTEQSDCDSGDTVFDFSSVPVVEYTLLKLMNLTKSIEMEEMTKLCARYADIPESVFNWILELYWNGDKYNLLESLKLHRELTECSSGVKNDESVVFQSISSENFNKLAHCDILNDEICLSSEEFRSSWLNVDGQPADIDKVLSEPLPDYVPSNYSGENSLKEDPEVTSIRTEQSVKPNTCSLFTESHTEVFTPLAGNGREETAIKDKGPADLSPLSEMPSEELTDHSKEMEVLNQEHIRVTQDVSLTSPLEVIHLESDSFPVRPVDKLLECASAVSDDLNKSKVSFSTEALSKSTNTLQVEDISDNENSGNKEAASNSTVIWQVKDISDDEKSGKAETLKKLTDVWQVEDISDNENSGKTDVYMMEDVSNDENSSDHSLLMEVTVLSSEDARNLFHQLEKEPQCNIKTKSTQSNIDSPELMAWFSSPSAPNHKCSEVKICFRCGSNHIEKSTSNHVIKKDNDGELFCSHCWDEAPSLELESESCSPKRNKSDAFGILTKSDEQEQRSSPPTLELEVLETTVPSTEAKTDDKGQTGQKSDSMVKSAMPDLRITEIQSSDEEEFSKIETNMLKSDKISLTKLQMPMQHNTPPPTESVFVKHKPKFDTTSTGVDDCVLFQQLETEPQCNVKAESIRSSFDSTELVAWLSSPSQPNHACSEAQICSGCGTNCTEKSNSTYVTKKDNDGELLYSHCWNEAPSLELESESCSPKRNKTDAFGILNKSDEQEQRSSPPTLELEVQETTVPSEANIEDKELTGQKSDHMVKSAMPDLRITEIQSSDEEEFSKIETYMVKSDKISLTKLQMPMQHNTRPPTESVFVKHKPKFYTTSTGVDDCVLLQQLETKPQCNMKAESIRSSFDSTELVAWLSSPSQPNHVCSEAQICSGCGTNCTEKSNSTYVTKKDNDGELLYSHCWNEAPSLELESESCSPKRNKTDAFGILNKSDEQEQRSSPPTLELEVQETTVPSEANIEDKGLTGQKNDHMVKSAMPDLRITEIQSSDEEEFSKIETYMVKSDKISLTKLQMPMQHNAPPPMGNDGELFCSNFWVEAPSLELEGEEPIVPSTEAHFADDRLAGQKSDSMVRSAMPNLRMPGIQSLVKQELPKIQSDKVKSDKISRTKFQMPMQRITLPPTKSVVKQKPKSGSTKIVVDDCELFAPDVVIKKNWPQKKNFDEHNLYGVSEINHSSGENQNCRNLKKVKDGQNYPLQAMMDRNSQNLTKNLHKLRERVSIHSNTTPCMTTMPHKSNKKLDMYDGAQSVKKITNEKNKVKFALYGSKGDQCLALERRPSAPPTLTVSNAGKDYACVLSAKQKVHNQWSSTYIPKVKKISLPKSPQEKKRMPSPPKSLQKKMKMTFSPPKSPKQNTKIQKPQEVLKSNMDALKSQLKQRAMQLSSKVIELNSSRKPFSQQKLTNTLHG
ncbi:uncharacterized protein LOC127435250 [Myxocyprinus asiaticus]|uniref:uncharacterized protein LOC127435250 n=1 Tax=Myxocyprinus asiaticus TaxID=70543 RepID=UPI00222348EA|nr:uncharacterized protein LOC127435250 [Myxocyprinus asiaticus]